MDPLLIAAVAIPTVALIAVLIWAFRQSQHLRLAELSAQEKLLARESELGQAVQSLHRADAENQSLASEVQSLREQKAKLETSLEMEQKQHGKDLAFLNESKEQLSVAFKNIANEIFEDKSKKFVDNNKESLSNVLTPLQDKIRQFEKRVEETYDKESK